MVVGGFVYLVFCYRVKKEPTDGAQDSSEEKKVCLLFSSMIHLFLINVFILRGN